MKNRDVVSSTVWMALGGLFVAGAWHEGLMRKGVPGPGFLPFFAGLALILVSLLVLIPALLRSDKVVGSALFPEPGSYRRILLALAALFAFGAAIEYAGYLITTFLFMVFVSRLMEPTRWRTSILLASVTAGLSYLLFVVLLEVQLPKGPLGF